MIQDPTHTKEKQPGKRQVNTISRKRVGCHSPMISLRYYHQDTDYNTEWFGWLWPWRTWNKGVGNERISSHTTRIRWHNDITWIGQVSEWQAKLQGDLLIKRAPRVSSTRMWGSGEAIDTEKGRLQGKEVFGTKGPHISSSHSGTGAVILAHISEGIRIVEGTMIGRSKGVRANPI